MKDKIITMLKMQDEINCKINPDWINANYEWYRALWLECGELVEHHGYKWWAALQHPDMAQVRLEVVDIWHFGLSMMLVDYADSDVSEVVEYVEGFFNYEHEKLSILESVEYMAGVAVGRESFDVDSFTELLAACGMTFDDLYTMYIGKNMLNQFRQNNGYQDGTYLKVWNGREDNEHLTELIGKLDSSAADFEGRLYEALDTRYEAAYDQSFADECVEAAKEPMTPYKRRTPRK